MTKNSDTIIINSIKKQLIDVNVDLYVCKECIHYSIKNNNCILPYIDDENCNLLKIFFER